MAELKNSSSAQEKGLWAEQVTIGHFLKQGYQLLYQRKKMKYGEIDLIFHKAQNIIFVEVKFLHNAWMAFERLSVKQKQRILKNQIYYQQQNLKFRINSQLCFVDKLKNITQVELN